MRSFSGVKLREIGILYQNTSVVRLSHSFGASQILLSSCSIPSKLIGSIEDAFYF
jgi:hypothetical protein